MLGSQCPAHSLGCRQASPALLQSLEQGAGRVCNISVPIYAYLYLSIPIYTYLIRGPVSKQG